jgi:hypothetical protein
MSVLYRVIFKSKHIKKLRAEKYEFWFTLDLTLPKMNPRPIETIYPFELLSTVM